jgi:hypothetical protein
VKRRGCFRLWWLAMAETAAGPGGAASPMLLLCFFSLFPLFCFSFLLLLFCSSSFLLLLYVFLLFFSLFLCFLLLLLSLVFCFFFLLSSVFSLFFFISVLSLPLLLSFFFFPVSSFSPVFIGGKRKSTPLPCQWRRGVGWTGRSLFSCPSTTLGTPLLP